MTTPQKDFDIRCTKCGKLLAKDQGHGAIEIKCTRCGSLNIMCEKMDEQVIVTNPEGVILYTNGAVQRTTGYSLSEVIGQKPSLWGGQMSPEFYKVLWHTIKVKKESCKVTVRNKRKDGTLYDALLQISPVLDTTGEIRFFVGVETVINNSKNNDNTSPSA